MAQNPSSSQSNVAVSLSRRLFWQALLAFVGIVLLISLLGYSSYTIATVSIPDKGGIFREGVAGSPQYLTPLRCQGDNQVDQDLCALLFRGLTKIDHQGRVCLLYTSPSPRDS